MHIVVGVPSLAKPLAVAAVGALAQTLNAVSRSNTSGHPIEDPRVRCTATSFSLIYEEVRWLS